MRHPCTSARLVAALVTAMALMVACGPSELDEPEAMNEVLHQEVFGGDLGRALGWPLVTGDTCGKSNDFTPSCALSSTAPNVVYTWTAPSTDVYTFSTEGSVLDTVLELRSYSDPSFSRCNDDDQATTSQQARLSNVSLTAGQTVLIAVDGYGAKCGGFRLGIRGSCGAGCNSPPSGCHEAVGTCTSGTCAYQPKAAGASCSDSNACTAGDSCNGAGQCIAGSPITCSAPPNSCYSAAGSSCRPSTGCLYTYRCTANQYCDRGLCRPCCGTSCPLSPHEELRADPETNDIINCPITAFPSRD